MASVIAFGLLGSMFFTLIVIPVRFVAVHSRKANRSAAKIAMTLIMIVILCGQAQSQTRHQALHHDSVLAHSQNTTIHLSHSTIDEANAKLTQARADYFPVVTNQTNAIYMNEKQHLTIPEGGARHLSRRWTRPSKGRLNRNPKAGYDRKHNDSGTTFVAVIQDTRERLSSACRHRHSPRGCAACRRRYHTQCKETLLQPACCRAAHPRLPPVTHSRRRRKLSEARNSLQACAALEVEIIQASAEIADAQHALGVLKDTEDDLRVDLNDLLGTAAGNSD